MKSLLITIAVFLALSIGMMGYVIGVSQCVRAQIVPTETVNVSNGHDSVFINYVNYKQ